MVTLKIAKTHAINGTGNGSTAKTGLLNSPGTAKISSITSPKTGQALLLWSAPPGNQGSITGYRIERKLSGGSYTLLVDRTDDAEPGMLDTSVTSGSTYYYRIYAITAEGIGPVSAEVSVVVT